MADVTVERARVEDIPAMQDVWYESWLATYPNEEVGITRDGVEERWKNRHSPEKVEKMRAFIEGDNESARLFVARVDGKVVGVCRVSREENFNELNALYVLPDYLGQGIGTQLWNEAHTFLDARKVTYVYVATYNARAIRFYEKLGFIDTGGRVTEDRLRVNGIMIPQMEMKLAPTT